jgi:hypothetical protein
MQYWPWQRCLLEEYFSSRKKRKEKKLTIVVRCRYKNSLITSHTIAVEKVITLKE